MVYLYFTPVNTALYLHCIYAYLQPPFSRYAYLANAGPLWNRRYRLPYVRSDTVQYNLAKGTYSREHVADATVATRYYTNGYASTA